MGWMNTGLISPCVKINWDRMKEELMEELNDEIIELMRKIAQYQHTIKTLVNWIRKKAKATSALVF